MEWTPTPEKVFVTGGEYKGKTVVMFCFSGEFKDFGREMNGTTAAGEKCEEVDQRVFSDPSGGQVVSMPVLMKNGLF